ncbi:hypothetical protein Nepgr_014116 [Nepenthes gracilis]|uniref:Uncharacterized protein n=1 Tax=Nepenthes gracilis TaxID=150966 RepID=A0AAD3SIL6_NEPGR|nr:hypothetical protein Nepgr_014116 [Nepenthes gracilis]
MDLLTMVVVVDIFKDLDTRVRGINPIRVSVAAIVGKCTIISAGISAVESDEEHGLIDVNCPHLTPEP